MQFWQCVLHLYEYSNTDECWSGYARLGLGLRSTNYVAVLNCTLSTTVSATSHRTSNQFVGEVPSEGCLAKGAQPAKSLTDNCTTICSSNHTRTPMYVRCKVVVIGRPPFVTVAARWLLILRNLVCTQMKCLYRD
jgi:hypothetical protein